MPSSLIDTGFDEVSQTGSRAESDEEDVQEQLAADIWGI